MLMVTVDETRTPTVEAPKLTDAGVNSTPVPVPYKATVCGLVASLSATLRVPVGKPTAVGVNTTSMAHVPAAAITSWSVQLVVASVLNGPEMDMAGLPSVNEFPVLLVSVMILAPPAGVVIPTGCAAKTTECGLRTTLLVPVPVIPANCGLLGSLSLTINAPCLAPVVGGVKVTLIVQLALPARVLRAAGHVFADMAKSIVSSSVIAPMVMALVPTLWTVTVLGALVVFAGWLPKASGPPVTEIALPVPVRPTVVRLLKYPLSSIKSVPVRVPPALGLK